MDRVSEFFKQENILAALFTNPATITWLTGYAAPIQTGPSPFEGGPALGWWHDGKVRLVMSDMEAGNARALGLEVRDYLAYTIEEPIAGFQNQAQALWGVLSEYSALRGGVGVEYNHLPAPQIDLLRQALPNVDFKPLDGRLEGMRAIKNEQEIEKIKAALKLCDFAQEETALLARAGRQEIEIWGALKGLMEIRAGGRLPVLADFIAGVRTADIGGLPGNYSLQEGDPVIADIVPRLNGYWGDNAGTYFVGEPAAELRKAYEVVKTTLQKGLEAVKPGVKACDLDAQMREAIQQAGYPVYPHHSGHGIGTSYHEEPRIVPYNPLKLESGMVVALEPGIYLPGVGGVRLEDVALVTADGCEVLTHHLGN
jgi:Xaa-Pro aminopeptidase